MKEASKEIPAPIGVLVGRFQVHKLHQAHIELIDYVAKKHKKTIIFLGVSPTTPSRRNPLDFKSREKMIRAWYPNVTILPISDQPTDCGWSQDLDKLIRLAEPHGDVRLYGARDSFLNHYCGDFLTTELESKKFVSGTEIRKNISEKWFESSEFRAGVIYGTYNSFPKVYPTVDVAVFKDHYNEVLLAKKPNEKKYRFIGGFVDPKDETLAAAARREVGEESGIEIGNIRAVTSMRVDDWRYRLEDDKIMTTLFAADYIYGALKPQDDISELAWFNVHAFDESDLEEVHIPLWRELTLFIRNERTKDNGKEHSSTDRLVQADPLADVSSGDSVRDELPGVKGR